MDIFDGRAAAPMLIGITGSPFDDPAYLFELKLDGDRVMAYADQGTTSLISRGGVDVTARFPELSAIGRQVKGRCILDGEIIIMTDGKPDFAAIRKRLGSPNRRPSSAGDTVASLVVFDIVYQNGRILADLPLSERLDILNATVRESDVFSLSRTVEGAGTAFSAATKELGLEGVIAKRKDSVYQFGKRTREWVKIKHLLDDDFIVCGYRVNQGSSLASLVLGQYDLENRLVYRGRVAIGASRDDFRIIREQEKMPGPPYALPVPVEKDTVWIRPLLVCRVSFLNQTASGALRHPTFQGLRMDKSPGEARELEDR